MAAQIRASTSRGTRACARSDMLFTNTRRGVFHSSGLIIASLWMVMANPGPHPVVGFQVASVHSMLVILYLSPVVAQVGVYCFHSSFYTAEFGDLRRAVPGLV